MLRRYGLLAALVALFAIVPLVTEDRFTLDIVVVILIYATFATAWNVAGGLTGLFSLGHAALFAIGAYGAVLLHQRAGLPVLLAVPLAAVIAVGAGLLIGLMSLRLRGHYFALATLAFGATVLVLLSNFPDLTGGDEGISLPFQPDPAGLVFAGKVPYLYIGLGLYAVTAAVATLLFHSKWGFRMRAIREDEVTARSMGIPVLRAKLLAVGLSGLFSSLAGSLFAFYTLYITPGNTASIDMSLQPALMAIIGGMLGVVGPLLGAVLIVLLEQQIITTVGADVPGLSPAIYGGLLIVSILVLPNGLLGLAKSLAGSRRASRQAALVALDDARDAAPDAAPADAGRPVGERA
jgi:branched-chain amino acid transport system permease protein